TWVAEMPVTVNLAPGTIIDVNIVLRPAGQIRITNDFQNGPAVSFALSPAALTFGNVPVGASLTQTVTVTNTGSGASLVPPLSITASPTDPTPQFAIVGSANPNACSATAPLAAGAACTVAVSFAPTSTGLKTASLLLGTSPTGVMLSGTGVSATPTLVISPSPVAFGN